MNTFYAQIIFQATVVCLLRFSVHASDLPQVASVTNISASGFHPCWSPDSRSVAFAKTNGPGIWVYSRDSGTTHQICSPGDFPAWSPKGDRIAFYRNSHLWLMGPDGTHQLVLLC